VKEPAKMKLLVVVDKLLTGFDAPSCTYLYIDKSMQDHGLFQAICRTNRLDGDDKNFGHIVDYKDLFKKVEKTIAVYTSELDHSDHGADPEVLVQDRLTKGKERLDQVIEQLALLCEPVAPPKGELEHIHYFCGNVEIPTDLKERAVRQIMIWDARRFYRELDADQLLARHFALSTPPIFLVNGIQVGGTNGLPLTLLRDVIIYVQNRLNAELEEPQ
jgi:type I restriction enzyme R subunit